MAAQEQNRIIRAFGDNSLDALTVVTNPPAARQRPLNRLAATYNALRARVDHFRREMALLDIHTPRLGLPLSHQELNDWICQTSQTNGAGKNDQ